jgi:predicted DNA-binding transcriptional regulator
VSDLEQPTWFQQKRYDWIIESAKIFGLVRRRHISEKFGISPQQATKDIAEIERLYPGLLRYDLGQKGYVLASEWQRSIRQHFRMMDALSEHKHTEEK